MTEKERNLKLFNLLNVLITLEDSESLQLIKTMVEKDHPALQKTFEIMTENYKHLL